MIGSKVSKRYAKALFSIGQEEGNFDRYGKEVQEFTQFCKNNKEFGQAIANPIFAIEDRKRILHSVLEGSGFSGLVKNFLNLLLDKNRIGDIETIASYYSRLTDEASNIARAEIITAMPLRKEALEKLQQSLEGLTSKKIQSEVREDQGLIGGIVVKIGDLVLDGSVKAQIEGLKQSF
ncbi:MAG: ATP synthase F1 subunit delta [Pseudomonadota bacterium]